MIRALIVIGLVLISGCASAAVRIKDVADLQGVRGNQLVGYGLVVGLQGSGDTLQNSTFTQQSLESMLDRMGINVRGGNGGNGGNLRTRNVAAVLVTADLPPFIGKGSRIDVTVSSLGDANSLMGGTLILHASLWRRRFDLCSGPGAGGCFRVFGRWSSGKLDTRRAHHWSHTERGHGRTGSAGRLC